MGRVSEQPELTGLWDSFEHCSVHCQLMPERQIGHLRLLEVRVTAEFNGEADLTDWALQTASQTDSEEGPSAGSASQSTVLSGSGLYLWNLDTRTMHSFEFRATGKFAREQTLDSPQGDERLLIELSTEGQIRLEVLSASRR
jgi:hypothetical protein